MNLKTFLRTVALVFLVVTLVHLYRALTGGEVLVLGWDVPGWVSWAAILLAGYLSYSAFTLSKQTGA